MRFLNLTSFFRISIMALSMVLLAGPLSAQPNTDTTRPSATTVDRESNTAGTNRDNGSDWGWLGLFGLLGLTGLLPKKRTNDYDRGDTGNRTSNRP